MITQALTSSFKVEVLQGVHDFDNDVFKLALYEQNANLSSTTTEYTTAGESTGSGYTAGGIELENLGVSVSGTIAYTNWNSPNWGLVTLSTAGGLIYNASKGNKSVAVLNFGGLYTYDNANLTVPFPANTSTTAVVIFN